MVSLTWLCYRVDEKKALPPLKVEEGVGVVDGVEAPRCVDRDLVRVMG